MKRRRYIDQNYCIVGTGSRAIEMFAKDIVSEYKDVACLTGLCDINPGRLEWAINELGVDIPCFTNFDNMLDNVPCDVVIVLTMMRPMMNLSSGQ